MKVRPDFVYGAARCDFSKPILLLTMLLIGLVDHFKLFLTFLFRSNNAELVAQTTEVKSSKWVGIAICVTVVVVANLILTGAMIIYYSQTAGITTIMPETTLAVISIFSNFSCIFLNPNNFFQFEF